MVHMNSTEYYLNNNDDIQTWADWDAEWETPPTWEPIRRKTRRPYDWMIDGE